MELSSWENHLFLWAPVRDPVVPETCLEGEPLIVQERQHMQKTVDIYNIYIIYIYSVFLSLDEYIFGQ
jgi:hypothetical protein